MITIEEIKKALKTLESETNCNECVAINICPFGTCVFTETLNLLCTYEKRIEEFEDKLSDIEANDY